ncbi:alpha/beta hydrolase [Dactylosporangium sp. NBC_01737]|uniref:alpha/beta hydrolase n=1 Tax=Dactylosporangium sp. NBC_01737 TaxID=2975959 RepID=UPI002E160866|nr:alpha/beta hydrolase [Dactylosporangium sp. NBC_01737]
MRVGGLGAEEHGEQWCGAGGDVGDEDGVQGDGAAWVGLGEEAPGGHAVTVPAVCVRANIPARLDRLPAGVRGVEITGVGHWPHVHAPEATNQAIEALIPG